jgi:hypothetical protein
LLSRDENAEIMSINLFIKEAVFKSACSVFPLVRNSRISIAVLLATERNWNYGGFSLNFAKTFFHSFCLCHILLIPPSLGWFEPSIARSDIVHRDVILCTSVSLMTI